MKPKIRSPGPSRVTLRRVNHTNLSISEPEHSSKCLKYTSIDKINGSLFPAPRAWPGLRLHRSPQAIHEESRTMSTKQPSEQKPLVKRHHHEHHAMANISQPRVSKNPKILFTHNNRSPGYYPTNRTKNTFAKPNRALSPIIQPRITSQIPLQHYIPKHLAPETAMPSSDSCPNSRHNRIE